MGVGSEVYSPVSLGRKAIEIIKIKETKFLGKKCNVSKYNKKTYFGNCI